jgi:hypothetical protein
MGFSVGFILLSILYVAVSGVAGMQVSYAAFDKESGHPAHKKSRALLGDKSSLEYGLLKFLKLQFRHQKKMLNGMGSYLRSSVGSKGLCMKNTISVPEFSEMTKSGFSSGFKLDEVSANSWIQHK